MADIIAGRQPVLEALRAGRCINRLLLARDCGRHSVVAEILYLARTGRIPVSYVPRSLLDEESGSRVHQGVLAYASPREYASLEGLLQRSMEKGEAPLYCILDGIEDPQNLGAILRTACAAGFHGVVTRSRRAVGLTAAVSKASAGAIEHVPVARVTNIAYTIAALQERGLWIVAVDGSGESRYSTVDYTAPTAIVIGGEGTGVSDLVRRKCDAIVSIPMCGAIGSLNASVAAALVMYEAYRQRGWPVV